MTEREREGEREGGEGGREGGRERERERCTPSVQQGLQQLLLVGMAHLQIDSRVREGPTDGRYITQSPERNGQETSSNLIYSDCSPPLE